MLDHLERLRLVGAVGIENNAEWNFKDLEETVRSWKTMRRNNKEQTEILIGPSMAPRFSIPGNSFPVVSHTSSK
jgi:hypothetical protein